jgi:hypothetical protein
VTVEIVVCDVCKEQVSGKNKTLVSFFVEIPQARVVAEDDTSYTEQVDLCCRCAGVVLGRFVEKLPREERKPWLDRVRGAK